MGSKFEFVNKIICGDNIEIMRKMPDKSVDLIFADPPYWLRIENTLYRTNGTKFYGCGDEWDNQFKTQEDYNIFTKNWLMECKRILKDEGSIWVIGGMQCIYTIGHFMQEIGFWFINDVIWYKKNPTPNFSGTRLNNSHETLIWATKNKNSKFTFNYKTGKELNKDNVTDLEYNKGIRKQMGSVWRIGICQGNERLKNEDGKKLHSAQKPEELLYRIIAISTKIGDLVFDPFGGTMTTATIAKQMGRNYLSIENNKEYCNLGKKRVEERVVCIGDIEKAKFDIKPPRITLKQLLDKGYFQKEEKLYYNNIAYLKINKDGKVVDENGKITDIHSSIARIKKTSAKRLNGWMYWQVKRENQYKNINEIRKEYWRKETEFKL